jgi:hypothetical protein
MIDIFEGIYNDWHIRRDKYWLTHQKGEIMIDTLEGIEMIGTLEGTDNDWHIRRDR